MDSISIAGASVCPCLLRQVRKRDFQSRKPGSTPGGDTMYCGPTRTGGVQQFSKLTIAEFDSPGPLQNDGQVAQTVERRTENAGVEDSITSLATIHVAP